MARKISEERKAAYYVGIGLSVLGFLLIFSFFVTIALHFGEFAFDPTSMILRAIFGMAFIIVGGILAGIGSRGLAGSGVILDPDKAKEELEPYSRMAGGMLKDVMDEADIKVGGSEPEKIIMIKCRSCGKLNNEDAKFCQECGTQM